MPELRECPVCKGTAITMYAFSIDVDCRIACECGYQIEAEVPWGEMNETEHDAECAKVLTALWNLRPPVPPPNRYDPKIGNMYPKKGVNYD